MAARLSATLLRTQSDRRLAALAAGGSEPAFEAIVERYRRPLQAYCRRLLLDRGTAEDVVQQALLSTWQTLRGGTEIADVRSWLYRVTHNAALNALKRSGYRHEELDDAVGGAAAPDEDLDRRIAIRRTLAGLAALPELQREALLRTAVEGRSHEEVARELGLSDGAVRGLVYRARATLRAAATAVCPVPVVQWVASWSGRESAPMAERIGELVASGGSAGAAALLVKGSATVVATGALVGGAVVSERPDPRDVTPAAPAAEAAERPQRGERVVVARRAAAPATVAPARADTASGERPATSRPRPGTDDHAPRRARERDREDDDDAVRTSREHEDRDGGDDHDDDRSGSDDGDDRSGSGDDERTWDRSGRSGSDDDAPDDADASRSGSGDDEIEPAEPLATGSSGSGSSGSSGDAEEPDEPDEPDDG